MFTYQCPANAITGVSVHIERQKPSVIKPIDNRLRLLLYIRKQTICKLYCHNIRILLLITKNTPSLRMARIKYYPSQKTVPNLSTHYRCSPDWSVEKIRISFSSIWHSNPVILCSVRFENRTVHNHQVPTDIFEILDFYLLSKIHKNEYQIQLLLNCIIFYLEINFFFRYFCIVRKTEVAVLFVLHIKLLWI